MHSWLRLANLPLPPRILTALVERFGGAERVFAASSDELATVDGLTDRYAARVLDPTFIPTTEQLEHARRDEVQFLPITDSAYPRPLREISDAPPVLFVRGSLEERDRFAVAIVGSRRATAYGKTVASRIARDLAQAGMTVVSGGAVGIDTAAHQAVVESGGRTIAVLGCGLDVEYPRENQKLFRRIVDEGRGAVVTEFPMGASPEAWRFPARNRVISGLSMGVVVVEAGAQSGALLTAGIAGEQGREVMAVPGNVDRDSSRGANGLIRDGAVLVENANDVLRSLGVLVLESPGETAPRRPNAAPPSGQLSSTLPDGQRRLLENLSLTPRHIDALAADVCMTSSAVSVEMTLLELSGFVRRLPGNCYIRVL